MGGAKGKFNSPFEIRDSLFALRRPALFHQREQVLKRFFVSATFFDGELAGALVQLLGHLGGFIRRTAECDQNLGELRNFHRKIESGKQKRRKRKVPASCVQICSTDHFTASSGTILMLMMPTRLSGRSCGCVGVVAIFSSTSSPLINFPNVVY